MIDVRNALIQRMVDDGYDVSYHQHLKAGRVVVSSMACRKSPKATFTGRCRLGNRPVMYALAGLLGRPGR